VLVDDSSPFRFERQYAVKTANLDNMDTILCSCKNCDSEIGEFANLWTQVGKSYVSPVIEPDEGPAVLCHGVVRVGERGTLVEEWYDTRYQIVF